MLDTSNCSCPVGDGTLRLWDLSQSLNTLTVSEGGNEVLSCSWNKYQEVNNVNINICNNNIN